jgi:hypothetical protein
MRCLVALGCLALLVAAPARALARGGFSRPPDVHVVTAGVPMPQPGVILGGCGPKRVRDQATGKCRGPADLGN